MADDNGATQTTNPDVQPPFGPSQPDRSGFPYTGPETQDWKLPDPQARQPRTAGSPTGPFPTWPPPWRGARVQGFVPSFPSRPYQQWGDDRQFQQEPQPWEAPGIFSGVGKSLTQIGSGFVGASAGMMDKYSAAYMGGFAKGQEQAQRLRFEQLKMLAAETAERQAQELNDYRDVYSVFHGDPATGTGADPHLTLKGVGNLWDGLYSVARQYDDKLMIAALDSGNLASAENLLKQRDAKGSDLRAAIKAQEKDAAEREKERGWEAPGAPPAQSQAGPPAEQPAETPETPPPAPDEGGPAPEPAQPPASTSPAETPPADGGYTPSLEPLAAAPRPQGVQVAEAGASDAPPVWAGQLPRQRPQPAFQPTADTITPNAKLSDGRPMNPQMVNGLAQDLVNGDVAPTAAKNYPTAAWDIANSRAMVIRDDLRRIQANPNLRGQAVIDAIATVDPQLANLVKGYALGSIAPPRGATAVKEPWARIVTLANKYDPTFTGATFQTRASTLKDFTSGTDGRNLVSIATAYAHLHAVQNDLKRQPGLKASLLGKYRGVGPMVATDADRAAIGALDNDINTAAAEYERALTGGKPTVTGREEQMSDLNWKLNDITVLNANIQNKIDRLKERMDRLKGYFTAGTGRQPEDMFKLFDTFSRTGKQEAGSDELGATSVVQPGMANDLRALEGEQGAAGTGEKIHESSEYFK